mmetsp:Transcript_129674/g.276648  ORF Transcript_129674/g.276648 Transcript_129674/m.276648 type:complete len:200 (-) Transcript_129674:164-763(-)
MPSPICPVIVAKGTNNTAAPAFVMNICSYGVSWVFIFRMPSCFADTTPSHSKERTRRPMPKALASMPPPFFFPMEKAAVPPVMPTAAAHWILVMTLPLHRQPNMAGKVFDDFASAWMGKDTDFKASLEANFAPHWAPAITPWVVKNGDQDCPEFCPNPIMMTNATNADTPCSMISSNIVCLNLTPSADLKTKMPSCRMP